jgi:hypothetical protein
MVCSDRMPEIATNESIMARIRYSRLFPVLVAARPTANDAPMNHQPSRVGRIVRGSQYSLRGGWEAVTLGG